MYGNQFGFVITKVAMNTKNSNTKVVGIAIKNDNYRFVEMTDLQDGSFQHNLKNNYNDIIKINELIDEQSQITHDGTHLNSKIFFQLTDEEFEEREKFYELEGGIRIFNNLNQLFRFSHVNELYLYENNKWYKAEPFTIKYYLNQDKVETITLKDLTEL